MRSSILTKLSVVLAVVMSFGFTSDMGGRPEEVYYYIYAQSFSAKNKTSYFSNVFAINVGTEEDDAYVKSAVANAAIRKLENEFGSHLYAELDYGQVSTTGFYSLTQGKATSERSNSMALEKSKGNKVMTISLFSFSFDKDE